MNLHQQGRVASEVVRLNAGVDVSKAHLDSCVGSEQRRVSNDPKRRNEPTEIVQSANVDMVVVEATGGYERGMVCAPQGAGVCVARLILGKPGTSPSPWRADMASLCQEAMSSPLHTRRTAFSADRRAGRG